MRVATTPSRRERVSPPPVRPKIEHVFTPANTHRHRTPHPCHHAAHTTMVTGQHQATGSAHEHRATTTRVVTPAFKTLTPPHPRPVATPTKETSGKFAPLHTPGRPPALRPKGPAQKRPPSPVLLHRVQDKLGPAAGRETSSVLLPGARRALSRSHRRKTSNGPQLGAVQPYDGGRARTTRGGIEGRKNAAHRRPTPDIN